MRGTLLFLIAVVLVPLLILQSSVYYFWFHQSLEQEKQADLEFARVVAGNVNEFISDVRRQELAIGQSLVSLAPYTTEQANALLTANLKELPEVKFFSWVDLQGQTIAASEPEVMKINISGRRYFQEILNGRTWSTSDLLTALADQSPIIVVGRAIQKEDKLLGVVTAGISPATFDIFAHLQVRTLENATWAIFDHGGTILFMHPKPANLTGEALKWRQKDPLLAQAIDSNREVAGEIIWPINGEKRIAARVPVGDTGWIAGATIPKTAVTGPILKKLGSDLGMMGGIALLSVALALSISGRILGPLIRLKEHAAAVGSGDLEHRTEIVGAVEIEELANAFNLMGENLKQEQFEREQYLIHLNGLILASERMLAERTIDGLMKQVADSARELAGGRIGTAAYGYAGGDFQTNALSYSEGTPKRAFSLNKEICADLMSRYDSIRLTDKQLWTYSTSGLPEGLGPLRGLLGARMYGANGDANGLIVVSDKENGDFDEEDEALLRQLAALASLAMQNIEAKNDVQEAANALAISNRELEQFAYIASHDLQEPLRVITGYLQLLEKRYKNRFDSDADEFINFAVDGANRMQNLIVDLLAYSRVTRKARPFALFDSSELLKHAVANLDATIKAANAVVTYDKLPEVMADGTQLIQVFQNLIGNAVKFHSSKRPQIHVTAKHDTNEWVFSVKDNGIGIEQAYKERIFVIFQRLHSREEYPGTGIGLAICKKVVERHGGRIWLESEPGKGSTFYFTIPDKGD
jgi:signal transduction histidine kinase/HAMP domain-containing protein